MDPPPPYYTTAAALEATHTDLASIIRQLSNETVKVDGQFQAVYVALKRDEKFDESADLPSNQWSTIRKIYTNLLWLARNTATDLKSHTTELVDIIIPAIGDASETKQGKLDVLTEFINKPAPSLLTTERAAEQIAQLKQQLGPFSDKYIPLLKDKIAEAEKEIALYEEEDKKQNEEKKKEADKSRGVLGFLHKHPPKEWVDYQTKIKRVQEQIKIWQTLISDVEGGISEIISGLDTIPDRVGSAFSALWLHEKQDAEHIREVVQRSTGGRVGDIDVAADAYKRIKDALQYYSTNIVRTEVA